MQIEKADIEDLEEILNLQKIAFQVQAKIYNDYTIPPLIETFEEIKNNYLQQIFLKALIDDKIVGSVRGYKEGNTCHIGRLIVHPDFQNQGIGTKLMNEIELHFKDIKKYELFTGHKSKKIYISIKNLAMKNLKQNQYMRI
ncbi:MAG: GNAT family N-acetyltransferase [Promethearchaeota archaeon]